MDIGLTYRHRDTGKHFILLNEGLHRAEEGVPTTLQNYTAKEYVYDEENEPSTRDLATEWGVSLDYMDAIGTKLLRETVF